MEILPTLPLCHVLKDLTIFELFTFSAVFRAAHNHAVSFNRKKKNFKLTISVRPPLTIRVSSPDFETPLLISFFPMSGWAPNVDDEQWHIGGARVQARITIPGCALATFWNNEIAGFKWTCRIVKELFHIEQVSLDFSMFANEEDVMGIFRWTTGRLNLQLDQVTFGAQTVSDEISNFIFTACSIGKGLINRTTPTEGFQFPELIVHRQLEVFECSFCNWINIGHVLSLITCRNVELGQLQLSLEDVQQLFGRWEELVDGPRHFRATVELFGPARLPRFRGLHFGRRRGNPLMTAISRNGIRLNLQPHRNNLLSINTV